MRAQLGYATIGKSGVEAKLVEARAKADASSQLLTGFSSPPFSVLGCGVWGLESGGWGLAFRV